MPSWSTPTRLAHRPGGGPSFRSSTFLALAAGMETPAALGELTRERPHLRPEAPTAGPGLHTTVQREHGLAGTAAAAGGADWEVGRLRRRRRRRLTKIQ